MPPRREPGQKREPEPDQGPERHCGCTPQTRRWSVTGQSYKVQWNSVHSSRVVRQHDENGHVREITVKNPYTAKASGKG